MKILNRITRLFKADMHGILDALEQPEIILKQAVRDMQAEIDAATTNIATFAKQQEQHEQTRQNLNSYIEELQQQIQFCLTDNKETLSKSVIRKKLQAELSLKQITEQLAIINANQQQKITETAERSEKLQAIRDKLALFTQATELNKPSYAELNPNISEDDVELAFLYEQQRHHTHKTSMQTDTPQGEPT